MTDAERKLLSDRLRKIVAMCDEGKSVSAIRDAVHLTAYTVEEPAWDGLPVNAEAA